MKSFGVYSFFALLACLFLQTASAQTLDGPSGPEFALTACQWIEPCNDPLENYVLNPIGDFFQGVGNGIAGWFRSDDMLVSRLATGDLAVTELAILAAENADDPLALKAILVERQMDAVMDAGVRAAEKAEIKAEAKAKLCEVFPNAC